MAAHETMAEDRVMPHDLSAERGVLGAVLVHGDLWARAASELTTDDFYREAHRRIFAAMAGLREDGKPIDTLLLTAELRRTGDLDECGGPAYLSGLTDGVPRSANVEYYAGLVRETSRLRQAIVTANALVASAYDAQRPSAEIVDAGVRALLQVADAASVGAVPIDAAIRSYLSGLDQQGERVVPTGLADVDDIVGGFSQRHLSIVAARPSVGKTSLALSCAAAAARGGVPSVIVTLEVDPDALAGGLIASQSGVSGDRVRRGLLNDGDWQRISDAMAQLTNLPLYLVTGAYTLTQVAAWARRLRETHGVRLMFLDYLQLMGNQQARERHREVAVLSGGLKRLAKDEDIAVVALSQLTRESERRQDRRPQLSDLRESGALEQDADLVLLLYREEMHKPKPDNRGVGEVIVAKNRFGPVGTAKVSFRADCVRWANLAHGGDRDA